jgi:O-antigen/teichoic acid export membrane protein
MIRHGAYLQLANAVQLLNYRLSYLLIDLYLGRSLLGIYNAGVQLSEGIWIFGKSFALVQYSAISNSNDLNYAIAITLKLIKAVVVITFSCLLVLILLPGKFYALIFGEEFFLIKNTILYLTPGILMLSASMILSHFFSGTGKQQHNAIASATGLAATLVSGLLLIPSLGLAGAGLTATIAYSVITIYQMVIFVKISKCNWKDFMIARDDLREIITLLRKRITDN